MATVKEIQEVLKKIKELKYELVKIQEYESASIMREMEKKYLDKEVKIEKLDARKLLKTKEKKKVSKVILEVPAGRNIRYRGVEYQTGNRRHNEVELYKDKKFVRTIKVTARTVFVKPKVVTGACERNGKFSL